MEHKNLQAAGIHTRAIHAGENPDPSTKASSPNIVMSTTYLVDADVSFSAVDFGEETPYVYTRWGNPTIEQLEQKLASLEGAEAGLAFASGMAAITALLLYTLVPGDHLIVSDVSYAATAELTNDLIPRLGIEVTRVDLSDIDAVQQALKDNTRLIYAESPVNPIIRLTDIETISKLAHAHGVKFAVDATFASPIAVRPLELGADYVIHSLTKYLCGHGDAIGGVILGMYHDIAAIKKEIAIRTGGIISPFNAWLILRGIATLPIRMKAHEEGALKVAQFLETHPKVLRVIYPGLPSHPQYPLAQKQMHNFSGMLTFQINNGSHAARIFARELKIIHYSVSIGHHRSLIFYLPTQDLLRTSFRLTTEQERSYREYAGDGVFRLSVGLEDPIDLIQDLDQAISAI